MYPENLRYTKTHEWMRIEGNILTLGITFYAQNRFQKVGGITYIGLEGGGEDPGLNELPKVGTAVKQGEMFMVVECSKSIEDIISPVNGKIVMVNEGLREKMALDLIHQEPYGEGWFVKIEAENLDLPELMDAETYQKFIRGEG